MGLTKNSTLSMLPDKKFSDHLALRDESNRAYKKITAILRQNNQPVYTNHVFSDYMQKYNVNLGKEQVIVLINESTLFVMSLSNY